MYTPVFLKKNAIVNTGAYKNPIFAVVLFLHAQLTHGEKKVEDQIFARMLIQLITTVQHTLAKRLIRKTHTFL